MDWDVDFSHTDAIKFGNLTVFSHSIQSLRVVFGRRQASCQWTSFGAKESPLQDNAYL